MQRLFVRMLSLFTASIYLLGLVFAATVPFVAQAACNYDDNFSGNATSAATGQTLTFTSRVTRSGNMSDCSSSASVSIGYKSKMASGIKQLESKSMQFSSQQDSNGNWQSMAVVTFSVNISTIDRSDLPTPNVFEFYSSVWQGSEQTRSSAWNVAVTGAVGGSGAQVSVYFKPQSQSSFKANDPLQILFHIDQGDLNSSQYAGVQSFYLKFEANGQTLGTFTKSRAEMQSDQWLDTTVTSSGGFKAGTNNITVSLWQAGTSMKIAEATATLTGDNNLGGTSGNPGTGTPGNPNTGGTPGNPNTGGTPGNPTVSFINPLGSASGNLFQVFTRILKMMMGVLGALSVAMIIVGGFQMVLSQGNSEAYGKAKSTIIWAVMGLVIALLSFAIIAIIQNLLGADIPNPASFF